MKRTCADGQTEWLVEWRTASKRTETNENKAARSRCAELKNDRRYKKYKENWFRAKGIKDAFD